MVLDGGNGEGGNRKRAGQHAASADGSVIVGQTGFSGWRWTAATGHVALPLTPGATDENNAALGISANGQLIVGQGSTPTSGSYRGYIYNITSGYTMLQAGTPGGTDAAEAITPDGQTVYGDAGVNGNGQMGRWVNGSLVTTATSSFSCPGVCRD